MNKTSTLLSRLSKSQQKHDPSPSHSTPKKVSIERSRAERKYKKFTSLTKNEQLEQMRNSIRNRNPEWKHEFYRANNTFSIFDKQGVDEFPHNNKKYNVQFSQKSLEGGTLNFPAQENGLFSRPGDNLYSRHYVPIVTEKRKLNQDFELRTSLFGKTWVDHKRDKIMNEYTLQTNPFSTAKSNQLICLMRPARKHRFS